MDTLNRVFHWADVHYPAWLDYVRIGLGIILFSKGLEFTGNHHFLKQATNGWNISLSQMFISHYIPIVHLTGGLLIAVGLITRIAAFFQLPILIGAVIFSGMSTSVFDLYSEFGLALFVLVLLLVFLIYGSGRFSIDNYMEKHPSN